MGGGTSGAVSTSVSIVAESSVLESTAESMVAESIVSSSERSPCAAAWRSRLTVKVLVTLPIRWCTSGVIGSSEVRSATPRVPTHVYSGV